MTKFWAVRETSRLRQWRWPLSRCEKKPRDHAWNMWRQMIELSYFGTFLSDKLSLTLPWANSKSKTTLTWFFQSSCNSVLDKRVIETAWNRDWRLHEDHTWSRYSQRQQSLYYREGFQGISIDEGISWKKKNHQSNSFIAAPHNTQAGKYSRKWK